LTIAKPRKDKSNSSQQWKTLRAPSASGKPKLTAFGPKFGAARIFAYAKPAKATLVQAKDR